MQAKMLSTRSVTCCPAPRCHRYAALTRVGRQLVRMNAGQPGMTPEQAEAMKKAMADPQFASKMAAMQEAMKNPVVQQQMQAMQAAMQNQALQQRMEQLKDDPELAPMFEDIKKNGMGAMMKYYNDPKMLSKLGNKLADVPLNVPGGGTITGPSGPGADVDEGPEITTLLEAAKYGDLEAVEDFIAIGKDVNAKDSENRTPLHFAAAHDAADIATALIEAGAELEVSDSKQNTPLHYAAGYGRPALVQALLDAGANISARNHTGKTPADLVRAAPPNPINQLPQLLQLLSS